MNRLLRLTGLFTVLAAAGAVRAAEPGAPAADQGSHVADHGPNASDYGLYAADAHFDPAEMAMARAHTKRHHGGGRDWMVVGDRLEYSDDDTLVWDLQGRYGGKVNRAWFKTEGELEDGRTEESELQALYSRAVRPFWDVQIGLRRDFEPEPARTFGVVGLQGLAPYWFEIDSALFLSDQGDLSGLVEAEYDLRLTQRLLLQPRAELTFAFSSDPAIGQGSGINDLALGLRVRYEIVREFAPYIGVEWSRAYGETADLRGQDPETRLVAGVRFWF